MEFQHSISPSNENPGLISSRMDWLDLLAVQATTAWFQIRKGVCQGCLLSPFLFNLYAEYIMRNAGMDEAQAGIKTARRNINNLRHFKAESEELKSLLMKMKEESEKAGLKLHIQETPGVTGKFSLGVQNEAGKS